MERQFFSSEMLGQESDEMRINALGWPYRLIGDCAFPVFCQPSAFSRLQSEFIARSNDVFLVFPSPPMLDEALTVSVALVEQRSLASVDVGFPRWIDAAVSRRGWKYIEAIDGWHGRRCLTTHSPPWMFPASNLTLPGRRNGIGSTSWKDKTDDAESSVTADGPCIAVFITDPRYLIMKEHTCGKMISGEMSHHGVQLSDFIDAAAQCGDGGNLVQIAGGCLETAIAWADAEARDPEKVRLFFLEDFVLQPAVAMRGLANFLSVSTISDATEAVVRDVPQFLATSPAECPPRPNKLGSIDQWVSDFEKHMVAAAYGVRTGWENLVKRWLMSPNPRMVTMAQCVLRREAWDPPKFWAAHSARVCRPCLFFPRGKCHDDVCAFCHGPGHAKPKRPSKSARQRRKLNYDRTPSPDHYLD